MSKTDTKEYLLLLFFCIFAILNSTTANLMEGFVHFNNKIVTIGGLFRFISLSSIILIPIAILYNDRRSMTLLFYFVMPASIISLFFTNSYLALYKMEMLEFLYYLLFNISIIIISLYFFITFPKIKFLRLKDFLIFISILLLCFPLNFFNQFNDLMNDNFLVFKPFNFWYFMMLFIFIIVGLILNKLLKYYNSYNKEKILFTLSLILIYHLLMRFSYVRIQDYQTAKGIIGALPFYVCSFGIVILPFAIYSKNNFFQSLAFLINMPGAIIVIIRPTTGITSILSYNCTYFFLSHILLFAITLQFPLHLNGKPKLKHLIYAGAILILYFVFMLNLNMLAVSLGDGYDPNFSFVSSSPLPIPLDKVMRIHIWKMKFSPIYLLVLWIVHWLLCAITFLIYTSIKCTRRKFLK